MSELAGVVVAAGRGSRMRGDKLWIELWGRPVWRWSLDALLAVPELARVALVVPPGEVERFRAVMPQASTDRCLLVEGGEVRSASVELDRTLLEGLKAGDRIELVRTGTADIGVCILRAGELLWAVGAVTTVPLGAMLRMRRGPAVNRALDGWPRRDTWVEASIEGQTSRLHDGEELTLGEYRVTLARAFKDGIPGQYENAAISRGGGDFHEAAVRAARILGKGNAGLTLTTW